MSPQRRRTTPTQPSGPGEIVDLGASSEVVFRRRGDGRPNWSIQLRNHQPERGVIFRDRRGALFMTVDRCCTHRTRPEDRNRPIESPQASARPFAHRARV